MLTVLDGLLPNYTGRDGQKGHDNKGVIFPFETEVKYTWTLKLYHHEY